MIDWDKIHYKKTKVTVGEYIYDIAPHTDIISHLYHEMNEIMIETPRAPNTLMIWEPFYYALEKEMLARYSFNLEDALGVDIQVIKTGDTWSMTKDLRELIEQKGFLFYRRSRNID